MRKYIREGSGHLPAGERTTDKEEPVMRRLLQLATLSLVALLVFAPSAWAQGQEVTVRMEDNFFEPANITVEPGTTVMWVQSGDNSHTTTSYDGLWDSGMIEGGTDGTFSFTFEEPGTYDYFCIPHEDLGMVGTVTVSGGSASASASASATASASASSTALADTGGTPFVPLLTLAASLALVVSGLVALALLRRHSAS